VGSLCRIQAPLGVALHVEESITGGEEVRIQVDARVRQAHEITSRGSSVDGAAEKISARPQMFGPRNTNPESMIGAGLKPRQRPFFDQVESELAEPSPCLVVGKALPGNWARLT
jgi:hypothetical protein